MNHNMYYLFPLLRSIALSVLVGTLGACASLAPTTTPLPADTRTAPTPAAPPLADDDIRISAVGDIMLDGTARPVLQEHGYDYPFAHMRALFEDAHVVIGNLEGPLTTRGKADHSKTYAFHSPPDKVGTALKNAGFNVVTLANNHTLDYGPQGLTQTLETLDAAGILHVGAGKDSHTARRAATMVVHGQRIAFLGYSVTLPDTFYATTTRPGTAFGHEAHVRADVTAARLEADIVIVSFHWGQEGKTALREYQTRLGRVAIDAGAQAVLGHHPHILQAVEYYKDGVILYSLGNFVFGSYSKTAARSAVAQLTFRHGRLSELRMVPIRVDNFVVQFQPQALTGAEADAVVTGLQELSALQNTTLENRDGVAYLQIPAATTALE